MVPEISLLFAIVIYWWLLFFVNLILNANIFGFFIENKNYARLLGIGIFIIFIATKIIYGIGLFSYKKTIFIWEKLVPASMVLAIIIMIVLIIALVALAIFAPKVLLVISKKIEEYREKKKQEKQDVNREALDKLVTGATGQNQ